MRCFEVWTEGEFVAKGMTRAEAMREATETANARGADAEVWRADYNLLVARVAPIPNNCPNLDAWNDIAALWEFGTVKARRPVQFARELFPTRPRGYVAAARSLAAYATNKATAMRCRYCGDISSAQTYESICDRIYSKLPAFARSW